VPALLSLRRVAKSFGSVPALRDVDLEVAPGSVHAVLGENGAGKSTLMNVLYGLLRPDGGTMTLAGEPYAPRSPRDAIARGVGMVHQHFELVPSLTAAENLAIAGPGSAFRRHRRGAAEAAARALAERHRLDVEPARRVADMSVGEQQRLAILQALANDARLLVLDEPTATLSPLEAKELLALARAQAREGRSILFVSHRLDEVLDVSDRITVLRRGEVVETLDNRGLDPASLAERVVGSAPPLSPRERASVAGDGTPALEVRDLVVREPGRAALEGATVAVRRGEIVGVAGVDGNGQDALVRALAGIAPAEHGSVVARGSLAVVPGDRRVEGLVLDLSVRENVVLEHHRRREFRRAGFRRMGVERAFAERAIEAYAIRTRGPEEPVARLSGGNQQKVVLARVLGLEPDVLVAVDPTRGLDLRATSDVRRLLLAQRDRGAALLLVSSDLDEVLELADRVVVAHRGRLTDAPPGPPWNREAIGLLMLGGKRAER
jgi:general nucleoside transport system ATP-binding protein